MRFAAAIFARTPGYSAAKSRLAKEVGAAAAEKLYFQSLACCVELATSMQERGIDVCWAVAEEEALGDRFWQTSDVPTMFSGTGELGQRLANVHARLLEVADVGIMLGSDSPQLAVEDLEPVWGDGARERMPVIGPSVDGGFYLFADSCRHVGRAWEEVEYSCDTTRAQLVRSLAINPLYLHSQPDFDNSASLAQVIAAMPEQGTSAQEEFRGLATDLLDPGLLRAAMSES